MSRRWLSMRGVSGFAREVAQEGEPAVSFAIGAAGGDVDVFFFTGAPLFLRPFSARVSLLIGGEQKRETALRNEAGLQPPSCLVPRWPPTASAPALERPPASRGRASQSRSQKVNQKQLLSSNYCSVSSKKDGHVSSDDVIIRGYEHCPRMIRMIHVQGGMHNATSIFVTTRKCFYN